MTSPPPARSPEVQGAVQVAATCQQRVPGLQRFLDMNLTMRGAGLQGFKVAGYCIVCMCGVQCVLLPLGTRWWLWPHNTLPLTTS